MLPGQTNIHKHALLWNRSLEMTSLSNTISFLWDNALGNGTMTTYNTGVKSFKTFLLLNNIASDVTILPEVSRDIFLMYTAYCYNTLQINIELSNYI